MQIKLGAHMWAFVHNNHSSWLKQDNAETVGGVATQSTVPRVPHWIHQSSSAWTLFVRCSPVTLTSVNTLTKVKQLGCTRDIF